MEEKEKEGGRKKGGEGEKREMCVGRRGEEGGMRLRVDEKKGLFFELLVDVLVVFDKLLPIIRSRSV